MAYDKRKDLEKAVGILRTMFDEFTDHSGKVMVGLLSDKEVITVVVNGASYDVNVECENVRQMVKSVVDAVILKL